MAEKLTITSERPSGPVELEASLALPGEDLHGGVVLCHPHPAGGGAMDVGLLTTIERRLLKAGFAALRFNFEGVGGSSGHFTDGLEEPLDVAAAMEALRSRSGLDPAQTSLCGWSFGAWMALLALADGLDAATCVAIAPPLMLYDWRSHVEAIAASAAKRHYIVGANDQFCPLDFLEAFTSAISPYDAENVTVLPATDHYLFGREDAVAAMVAEILD
jgi:alpha/beta superfamily hydrolase